MPAYFDEPFSDSSVLPTLALSELTRRHITVSFSGDGGDELFCGYRKYTELLRLRKYRIAVIFSRLLSYTFLLDLARKKLDQRFMQLLCLDSDSRTILERQLSVQYTLSNIMAFGKTSLPFSFYEVASGLGNIMDSAMRLDQHYYLIDNHMVNLDRATMSVALEGRVPFLDYRIVEFANSLSLSLKYRNGEKKYALRKILLKYVPEEMTDRPKHGFGAPVMEWLAHDLAPLADKYLSKQYL